MTYARFLALVAVIGLVVGYLAAAFLVGGGQLP